MLAKISITILALSLVGCDGITAYTADKIDKCITASNHSPEAIKACGEAYGSQK